MAPVRVMLSRSIIAYYDPIRPSRRHGAISRGCRLYAPPSLCGSAEATHETFPPFPAVLSLRAADPTPVGSPPPPVALGRAMTGFLALGPSRPPRSRLCQQSPAGCFYRRCIIRFMLRPAGLPRPPGWLRRNGALCAPTPPSEAPCHPRFSRRPSPGTVGSQARGANGKSPLVGTCTRPVRDR